MVTSVEPDHLEHYGGFDAAGRRLRPVPGAAPGGGRLVCADDPVAARLGAAASATTYGFDATRPSFRIAGYEAAGGATAFTADPGRRRAGPGDGARCPAATTPATPPPPSAPPCWPARRSPTPRAGVAGFAGVGRRSQLRGERDGVTYVDDYAHLPGEVAPALAAAREGGWGRVVCVFQPHRYSRTEALWADFADAFADADVLVVTEIYSAGEAARPGVSGRLVADAVRDAHAVGPGRVAARAGRRGRLPAPRAAPRRPVPHPRRRRPDHPARRAAGVSGCRHEASRPRPPSWATGPGATSPSGPFTTYGVGGPAALFLEDCGPDDLALAGRAVAASGVPVLVVGRGSNLLVADAGFPGLALTLGELLRRHPPRRRHARPGAGRRRAEPARAGPPDGRPRPAGAGVGRRRPRLGRRRRAHERRRPRLRRQGRA